MKVGSVVPMTSCKLKEAGNKNERVFKAAKGHNFVFVFLGTETPDEPLDIMAVMKRLGWKQEKNRP